MKLSHNLSVFILCATSAWALPETGVSAAQIERVSYRDGQQRDSDLRDWIEAKLGGALVGRGETRQVAFSFTSDNEIRAALKGRLFSWENLEVELYRVGGQPEPSLERAIEFGDHQRQDPPELTVVEVRGRYVLVISGPAAEDTALVLQLRELCWPKRAQERVDMLRREYSDGDFYIRYSKQAVAVTRALRENPRLRAGSLERYAPQPELFSLEGSRERLVLAGSIVTVETPPGGFTAIGVHSSSAGEASMEDFAVAFLGRAPTAQPGEPLDGLEDLVGSDAPN